MGEGGGKKLFHVTVLYFPPMTWLQVITQGCLEPVLEMPDSSLGI